jgi:hypothetical protein
VKAPFHTVSRGFEKLSATGISAAVTHAQRTSVRRADGRSRRGLDFGGFSVIAHPIVRSCRAHLFIGTLHPAGVPPSVFSSPGLGAQKFDCAKSVALTPSCSKSQRFRSSPPP